MAKSDGQGRHWITFERVKVYFCDSCLVLKKHTMWGTVREVTLLISQNHWAAEAGWEPSGHFPSEEPFLSPAPLCWSDILPHKPLFSVLGIEQPYVGGCAPEPLLAPWSLYVFPWSRGRPSVPSHFKKLRSFLGLVHIAPFLQTWYAQTCLGTELMFRFTGPASQRFWLIRTGKGPKTVFFPSTFVWFWWRWYVPNVF